MTEQMREFDAGEQVLIICKLTKYSVANEAYASSDASANYPTYSVIQPDGTVETAATAMTNQSTGYYYIYYTIPAAAGDDPGWWIVKFATEDDTTIGYDGFLVKR